jgi:hypothetical protein
MLYLYGWPPLAGFTQLLGTTNLRSLFIRVSSALSLYSWLALDKLQFGIAVRHSVRSFPPYVSDMFE